MWYRARGAAQKRTFSNAEGKRGGTYSVETSRRGSRSLGRGASPRGVVQPLLHYSPLARDTRCYRDRRRRACPRDSGSRGARPGIPSARIRVASGFHCLLGDVKGTPRVPQPIRKEKGRKGRGEKKKKKEESGPQPGPRIALRSRGTRSRQSEIIHKYRAAIWRVYELPIGNCPQIRGAAGFRERPERASRGRLSNDVRRRPRSAPGVSPRRSYGQTESSSGCPTDSLAARSTLPNLSCDAQKYARSS